MQEADWLRISRAGRDVLRQNAILCCKHFEHLPRHSSPMSKKLLTTPTILASSTLVLWNALEAHNHDANNIFTRAGLDPTRFKDQEARFTARSITRLHEVTIETTGDPCFMLKLGGLLAPQSPPRPGLRLVGEPKPAGCV